MKSDVLATYTLHENHSLEEDDDEMTTEGKR